MKELKFNLQLWCIHDSSLGRLEGHGDTGQDGDHDHDPVQVGDQAQQLTAETQLTVTKKAQTQLLTAVNTVCCNNEHSLQLLTQLNTLTAH